MPAIPSGLFVEILVSSNIINALKEEKDSFNFAMQPQNKVALQNPYSFYMKRSRPFSKDHSNLSKMLSVIIAFVVFNIFPNTNVMAQQTNQMVRLAKIKVDPGQLEKYNAALKEQMNAAIQLERGVLTYYAVAEKADPSSITILEIYADTAAYNAHITTPHFKKYKEAVKNMVKSLELVDVTLIASARKPS